MAIYLDKCKNGHGLIIIHTCTSYSLIWNELDVDREELGATGWKAIWARKEIIKAIRSLDI